MASDNQKLLTPSQVAHMLSVAPVTLRKWSQQGKLPSMMTLGGHRRYRLEEVLAFAKEHNHPIDMGVVKGDSKNRILVVDDDTMFADFLQETLADENTEVEKAYDGFSAGQKVMSFKPDVVLLDIRMPELDGLEVCRRIKQDENTRYIHVVGISGFCDAEERQSMINMGAEDVLAKPLDEPQLRTLLNSLLGTAETA